MDRNDRHPEARRHADRRCAFTSATGVTHNGGPQTNGGTTPSTANNSPVVAAPADKTIPTRTPFTLTGSATDSNGDTLTYLWEQTDAGGATGTGLTDSSKVNGPLFRVFGVSAQVSATDTLVYNSPGENLAGTDPSRTFPDLPQILAGNTNAATGTCPAPVAGGTIPVTDPALNCFSEFLPTTAWVGTGDRVLHFRLTARDEFTPDGGVDDPGGVSWDNLALTVDPPPVRSWSPHGQRRARRPPAPRPSPGTSPARREPRWRRT